MNLTWHIVKKDLRALKWPLGLWLLCIVAKLGVGGLLLNADGNEGVEWFRQMDFMAKILASAEGLSFVLVAALIQEDLMVGTTAFWMTRPISGARLLRAKLLTIGLVFLVAPVLITLPWWLGCHYGPGEIAWAAAETVAVHALLVLAALLWAAVTDGLGRFLMWTLVTLAVTPMITAILTYYLRKGRGPVWELMSTRLWLAAAMVVAGIAVVLVHQYLTRHTWRSITVIGLTLGLSILTLSFWPWVWNLETRSYGYLVRRTQGDWPATAEPAGLKFHLKSAEFTSRKDRPTRPGTLTTNYVVEGLSDSQGFIGYASEHSWHWPDGTSEQGNTWSSQSALNRMAAAKAVAVLDEPTAPKSALVDQFSMVSMVPATTLAKIQSQPPAYTLQARLRLMQFEAATRLPAQAGMWQTEGVRGERIAAVEKSGEELLVTFIRHGPSLWVDAMGGGQRAPAGKFHRYFLTNRTNAHVDAGSSRDYQQTRVGGVSISWQTLGFRATSKGGGPKPLLEAINALNDAELVKVTFAEQARFTHELQIDAAGVAQANP